MIKVAQYAFNHSHKFSALLLVSLLAACGGGSNGGGSNTDAGDDVNIVTLSKLSIGTCTSTTTNDIFINEMAIKNCDSPHEAEIAGITTLEEDESIGPEGYPGFLEVKRRAYNECQPVFEKFTGSTVWDSDYDIDTISPSSSTWSHGDRNVICMVVGFNDDLITGSTAR